MTRQYLKFAGSIAVLSALTACGAPREDSEAATAATPQAFCEQLAAMGQAPPPEIGGSNADELSELLAVSEASVADAVETFRDDHRDVYSEGTEPATDTYDSLPDDVRDAVDRIDAYAMEPCED
jgi:hypothetical protein